MQCVATLYMNDIEDECTEILELVNDSEFCSCVGLRVYGNKSEPLVFFLC